MEAHISIRFFRHDISEGRKSIHEAVSGLIGKPNKVWEKGVKPKIGIVPSEDGFAYELSPIKTRHVEYELESLLERVGKIKSDIEIALDHSYDALLNIAVYTAGQVNPGILLNSRAIQLLSEWEEMQFDIDIYPTDD